MIFVAALALIIGFFIGALIVVMLHAFYLYIRPHVRLVRDIRRAGSDKQFLIQRRTGLTDWITLKEYHIEADAQKDYISYIANKGEYEIIHSNK